LPWAARSGRWNSRRSRSLPTRRGAGGGGSPPQTRSRRPPCTPGEGLWISSPQEGRLIKDGKVLRGPVMKLSSGGNGKETRSALPARVPQGQDPRARSPGCRKGSPRRCRGRCSSRKAGSPATAVARAGPRRAASTWQRRTPRARFDYLQSGDRSRRARLAGVAPDKPRTTAARPPRRRQQRARIQRGDDSSSHDDSSTTLSHRQGTQHTRTARIDPSAHREYQKCTERPSSLGSSVPVGAGGSQGWGDGG